MPKLFLGEVRYVGIEITSTTDETFAISSAYYYIVEETEPHNVVVDKTACAIQDNKIRALIDTNGLTKDRYHLIFEFVIEDETYLYRTLLELEKVKE